MKSGQQNFLRFVLFGASLFCVPCIVTVGFQHLSFLFRYDLAELYLKLKNYDKADKVIKSALEQEKGMMIRQGTFLHATKHSCSSCLVHVLIFVEKCQYVPNDHLITKSLGVWIICGSCLLFSVS